MNAFTLDNFGDTSSLLKAIGLVNDQNAFEGEWVQEPNKYLKDILTNDYQRDALIEFVKEARGGTSESDSQGRHWIEVFSEHMSGVGHLRFYLVMDDQSSEGEVRLYLGVKFDAGDPRTIRAGLLFPLFRAATEHAIEPTISEISNNPQLIEQPGGNVELSVELALSQSRPDPGQAGIGGVGFRLSIPTDNSSLEPIVDLDITDLQLPGETTSRDLSLSLTDPNALKRDGIDLIFALIQGQLQAQSGGGGSQIQALGQLLGLDNSDDIPDFPLEDLATDCASALVDWLAQTLGDDNARAAWLSALADLINGDLSSPPATAHTNGVSINIGRGIVDIGLNAEPGNSGRPIITLSNSLSVIDAASGTRAAFKADLLRINLETGQNQALSDLRAELVLDVDIDTTPSGIPPVKIDKLALGLALDASSKPIFILELRSVELFETQYEILDLTNPEAVNAATSQAVGDALGDILGRLGPAGDLIAVVLGWAAPSGASTDYPVIDVLTFLGNPLVSLHTHWQNVFDNHTADVVHVLSALNELITGNAGAVTGSGTDASPWLIALDTTSQFAFALWRNDDENLVIGVSMRFRVDDLGERCTVLESRLRVALASIDLATGNTQFLVEVLMSALGRPRGGGRLELQAANLRLEVDYLGLSARWTPNDPLIMGVEAPNPTIFLDEIALPLDIPNFSGGFGDFFGSLTPLQWRSLERIGALLALQLDFGWLQDLIGAFHWMPDPPILGNTSGFRLSLEGLFKNPGLELRGWLIKLIRGNGGGRAGGRGGGIDLVLGPLGRLLTGNPLDSLHVEGSGTIADPYRIKLNANPAHPALALWLEPDNPIAHPDFLESNLLRSWRPGMGGLSAASLSSAIFSEFSDFDGALPGGLEADDITDRLVSLAALLRGTDGLCRPPIAPITDVTIHLAENETSGSLLFAHDAARFLNSSAPDRLVLITTLSETAELPPLSSEADHILDLREAGRDPLSYTQLPAQDGIHHILLAPREAAKLGTGDPQGIRGQVQRLKHALALLSAEPGSVIMADPGSGHAAWFALDEMGAGINDLILIGTPLTPAQAPVSISAIEEDMLARLAELIPPLIPSEPDDEVLALARSLIAPRSGPGATNPADLSLPVSWSLTKRASLSVHAVYGVAAESAVDQAITAIIAAGLSLNSQVRAIRRSAQEITGAGMGLYLPVQPNTASGALTLKGHVLTELIGADINNTGPIPQPEMRAAKRVLGQIELSRNEGWLIGGPGQFPRPALELRALELHGQFAYGGPCPQPDRLRMVLYGVRIHNQAYPRLEIDAFIAQGELGIEGLAAPSTPEIAQMLTQILGEIEISADTSLAQLAALLRGAGILSGGGSFDPISLSHWIDDPTARLSDALNNSALRGHFFQAITDFLAGQTNISFDSVAKQVTIQIDGLTGEDLFSEWSMSATLGASGLSAGEFRLGEIAGLNLIANLAPDFTAALNFDPAQSSLFGAALPTYLSLWPAADFSGIWPHLPPLLLTHVLSRALEGLRRADASAQPIIEAALIALNFLESGNPDAKVSIPPLVLSEPAAWLRSVLAQSSSSSAALDVNRLIDLLDALKPLTGMSGPAGVWNIIPGLSLRARAASGAEPVGSVLELDIDASQFQTGSEIAFGGSFGLHFALNSADPPKPLIAAHAGLRSGVIGENAVHLTLIDSEIALFLRPAGGSDIGIYPTLSNLAELGLGMALPLALDAVVDHSPNVGPLLADIGDVLGLRSGSPLAFDGVKIKDWAADPALQLAATWPALLTSGLVKLDPLLPSSLVVTDPPVPNEVTLTFAGPNNSKVSATLKSSPTQIIFYTSQTDLPFVTGTEASLTLDSTGLQRFMVDIGPVDIKISDGVHLRPVFYLDMGSASPEKKVSLGLALDAAQSASLELIYDFTAPVSVPNPDLFLTDSSGTHTDPASIAAGIMHIAIEILGGFIISLPEVSDILLIKIGAEQHDLRTILTDVILTSAGGLGLDPAAFQVIPFGGQDMEDLWIDKRSRIFSLIKNIAAAKPSLTIDNAVEIGLGRVDSDGLENESGAILGLSVGIKERYALVDGNISLWVENDNRWIMGSPGAGLFFGFLDTSSSSLTFNPLLRVDGLGLRIGRANAPLLESPIGLGSIALHILAQIGGGEKLGGVQVQLSEISVAVGGGDGGNKIAQGLLAETNDGDAPLAPALSPAISIQTRPSTHGGGTALRFRGGDGDGPWWLPIQRQYGPLYVGQIGLGTQEIGDELKSVSLLFDGNVSIAGLTAAVDDLELRYNLDAGGIFSSESWDVDLAGLAVSADLSGVSLAGGLRKFTAPATSQKPETFEYIGMLNARFSTYGLSIYGGYAREDAYTAFFAFGSILGPFGGPPCFFLTGIGGGFGINREIIPPSDMSAFNTFPMLAALDPQADLPDDLMDYMDQIRAAFPPAQGRYWFAAGISFTSFALVDGVAVIAVEFGDGFELSIFGLARMALPRPEAALISIELGLIARFSTSEGVLWIQAQLTDNSWLFHPSARLTGGFAFVSWFKGPNKGQFVLTLGGYHPNFSAPGYPNVPRLGFNWTPHSKVTIKAESYFALTSEAMMAGGLFEASAKYGSAYAHLSFGGNAIIFYDPFKYMADAHARVSAGIRIKTWLGTVNLSFSLGAWIEVSGPKFNGRAGIEVGPIDFTVTFGDGNVPPETIAWTDFAKKYLELAPGNKARAVTSIAGKGALPPASASGEEAGTADGSTIHPFNVSSEFELSITSTIPLNSIKLGTETASNEGVSATLGLSPMQKRLTTTRLNLSLQETGKAQELLNDDFINSDQIAMNPRRTGSFPKGVWGEAMDSGRKTIPKGEVITATEGADFVFTAIGHKPIPAANTGGIAFNQVEAGPRKPLPLRPVGNLRQRLVLEAAAQRQTLAAMSASLMPSMAQDWQAALNPDPTPHRASYREYATPMRIGLLSERIIAAIDHGGKKVVRPGSVKKAASIYKSPRLRGIMTAPTDGVGRQVISGTTLKSFIDELANLPRVAAPVLGGPLATNHDAGFAPLLRVDTSKTSAPKTVIARHATPPTQIGRAVLSAGRGRAGPVERSLMRGISQMMLKTANKRENESAAPRGLAPGEIAVFDMPSSSKAARFKTAGTLTLKGEARLIIFDAYGNILDNQAPAKRQNTLPKETAHFAVLAGDTNPLSPHDVRGWTAGSSLAYFGRSLARCAGGFVCAAGASRSGGGSLDDVGWLKASRLTDQAAIVKTTFEAPAQSVAIIIDGIVDESSLASLALSFEGPQPIDDKPILVPFDGQTLIVYEFSGHDKSLTVHIGGLTSGRLNGVVAADIPPDDLVTRFVNEMAMPSLNFSIGPKPNPVEFSWTKPADIPAEKVE